MFIHDVWSDVGLVVCYYSWYATMWEAALTVDLRVPTFSVQERILMCSIHLVIFHHHTLFSPAQFLEECKI